MLVTEAEPVKDIALLPHDIRCGAVANFMFEVLIRERYSSRFDELDLIHVGELVVVTIRSACYQMVGEEVRPVNGKRRGEINGIQERAVTL